VDFYVGTLGLRLVKRTVNFDDPGTWHLYYGDRTGSPGTLITFFPWEGMAEGKPGVGEVSTTSYATGQSDLAVWAAELGVTDRLEERFGQPMLRLRDTDGSRLELIGVEDVESDGPSVAGFHGVTLEIADPEPTARLLADVLGYEFSAEEAGRTRLAVPGDALGRFVDLEGSAGTSPARLGSGSVHHVAFRARDDEHQAALRERLLSLGFDVTPVRDRQYFRSIYFREPGGVLFEIATDPPGMLIDEPVETLGTELRLPPWYESARERITSALPPISAPDIAAAG
jgi:glyoxalase family protein